MRSRLVFVTCAMLFGVGSLYACGGKKPPKEPAITETVTDAGAEEAPPPPPPVEKSLYERLGAKEGIAKIVDGFYAKASANPKTKKRFNGMKGAKVDAFKATLVEQIAVETGAPEGEAKGDGGAPKKADDLLKPLKLSEDEWNAILADLKGACDDAKIPDKDSGELFSLIALKKEIAVPAKPGKK